MSGEPDLDGPAQLHGQPAPQPDETKSQTSARPDGEQPFIVPGVASDLDAALSSPPPPPPPVLTVDGSPDVPALITVDTRSMSVKWNAVTTTLQSKEIRVVEFVLLYTLEMHQVDAKEKGVGTDRWNVQYTGPATFVQINGLRPGRSYALRVTCHPQVSDPEVVVEAAPPSGILVVNTPPTPPSAPEPLGLAVRQRNTLKFKWPEPEEDGGHPVVEYVFECHPPPLGHDLPPTPEVGCSNSVLAGCR